MFTPLSMGTNLFFGQDNYVPLMKQNFEIRVYNMDGSVPTEFSSLLTLATDTVGSINEEQDVITVHYGNGIIKFPNKVTFSDVDWSLNCYCSPNVLEGLRAWRKLCFDSETERMGLPSEYMKLVYFIKYDGQGKPRDAIRCPGTWIKGLENGDGDQSGDLVKVRTTLVISKAIYMTQDDLMNGTLRG